MNINLKRLINQNKLFNALKMFILNFRNTNFFILSINLYFFFL